MKSKEVNQKSEKSKKFNLDKVEILKLDTLRKISGGYGGIGNDLTPTIKTVRQSTADCR